MRLSLKHLLALWFVLLLVVGALLYNAYGKLRPEIFISLLSEQVQRNYPGTRLEVGKVDYRVSVDFNMGLKNILLKRNEKIIGSLEEIEVRLPWWLLLFERGNAQVNLNNLVVYVDGDHKEKEARRPEKAVNAAGGSASRIKLTVPDYLARAQFTLRAKDVTVKDLKNSRRYFTLNKLLVREFQFGKNSAFELNLPIHISHNETTFASELWLFGDLTPALDEWALKFRGEFRASDIGDKFQLEDLIIDGRAKLKPQELDVVSELLFFIEKKQVGKGEFRATERDLAVNLKLTDFPLNFLALFEEEIKNPYLPLLDERASGTIDVRKHYREELIKLEGFLEFPGSFPLGLTPEGQVSGKWRLNFNGSKWETSFMNPTGQVSFFRRSVVDFSKGEVAQYVEELGFSDIEFLEAVRLVAPLEKFTGNEQNPYSSTTVSFRKCRMGDQVVNGQFRYGVSPGQKFYVADLNDGQSSFKANFEQTPATKKIDLIATRFPWLPQYKFLGTYFTADSGVLDGKLEGRWNEGWREGQWLSRLKVTGLGNARGECMNLIDKYWKTFSIDATVTPDQQWNFSLKNGVFNLDSLLLEGVDPAKLTGQVDLNLKKKSFLVLNYPKNKKWKPVRKEVSIPFLQRNENE